MQLLSGSIKVLKDNNVERDLQVAESSQATLVG